MVQLALDLELIERSLDRKNGAERIARMSFLETKDPWDEVACYAPDRITVWVIFQMQKSSAKPFLSWVLHRQHFRIEYNSIVLSSDQRLIAVHDGHVVGKPVKGGADGPALVQA